MSIELVVDRLADAIGMAVVEDGRLVDLWSAGDGPDAVEDRLFLARVTGLEPAVDGAFLDHGAARPGFLAGKDARHRRGLSKRVPIGKCVEVGEWLVVQGMRAAEGDKGARLTTDLRLPGVHLVYRPHAQEIQCGKGIRAGEREAVAARGRALLDAAGAAGGLVLRRLAAEAEPAVLEAELAALAAAWARAQRLAAATDRRAGPLAAGPSPLARLVWRALDLAPVAITVADDALKAELRRLVAALPEAARPELELLASTVPAFRAFGVDAAIAEAAAREVALDGGGRLLIEETAACVAIDVDGGGRPALEVDLVAAAEIGRLARLRNLGGTLVVDFVDLATRQQRQRLDEALRRAFKGDPLPVQIYPMSPLGMVEISRAKRGTSPLRAASRRCPQCGGLGWTTTHP